MTELEAAMTAFQEAIVDIATHLLGVLAHGLYRFEKTLNV